MAEHRPLMPAAPTASAHADDFRTVRAAIESVRKATRHEPMGDAENSCLVALAQAVEALADIVERHTEMHR